MIPEFRAYEAAAAALRQAREGVAHLSAAVVQLEVLLDAAQAKCQHHIDQGPEGYFCTRCGKGA